MTINYDEDYRAVKKTLEEFYSSSSFSGGLNGSK